MSRHVRAFLVFWYDFVVGDDWRIALAVVAGLVVTFLVAVIGVPAWWVLPLAVALVLPASVLGVARRAR
jgi:hypothetical protein